MNKMVDINQRKKYVEATPMWTSKCDHNGST